MGVIKEGVLTEAGSIIRTLLRYVHKTNGAIWPKISDLEWRCNYINYGTHVPHSSHSGVLSELLTEGGGMFSDTLLTIPLMATETSPPQIIRAVLKAPTAHGVKNTQEEVTFIQKG